MTVTTVRTVPTCGTWESGMMYTAAMTVTTSVRSLCWPEQG